MRKYVRTCDACEKEIEINKNAPELVLYHTLNLDFHTFMIDPNTSQEEEVSNMYRKTNNVYCDDCFTSLTQHMEDFISEVSPTREEIKSEFAADVNINQEVKE